MSTPIGDNNCMIIAVEQEVKSLHVNNSVVEHKLELPLKRDFVVFYKVYVTSITVEACHESH